MHRHSSPRNRNRLIASVAGAFDVLEVFGQRPGPLSLSAIVQATHRAKSSVHRILSTLIHVGYIEQSSKTGLYRLSLKIWRLGMSALSDYDIIKVSQRYLDILMQTADETVHLSTLDPSGGIVYISKVESPRSIRVQTHIGRLNPSWCTATGRALLAFNSDIADRVLAGPLAAQTPKSVTDPKRLRQILAEVAADGYAVTKEENHPEMGGIAAPIYDHTGHAVAACGVAIPSFRMDRALIQRCIPLVVRTAAAISHDLGYYPSTLDTTQWKEKRATFSSSVAAAQRSTPRSMRMMRTHS